MNIEIESSSVVQTTKIISAEYSPRQIKSKKKLYAILKHLIKDENILNPRDGQIEAKGYRIETTSYKRKIYYQVTRKYYQEESILHKLRYFYWIKLCHPKYFCDSDVSAVDLVLGNFIPISGALNNVGLAFLDLGYTDDALFYFEKSINFEHKKLISFHKKRNLARMWTNKARAFSYQKDYAKAITACKKAVEIDKKFYWTWGTLGDIHLKANDIENATNAFNTATRFKPKWAYPWVGLGTVYIRMEKYDEAIVAFQKASKLKPKWAVPWDGLGFVYIKLKRYSEAESAYQKAISLAPKWASLWNNLGSLYVNLNKIEDAIAACQRAIAISPKSAISWINLAEVYIDSNKQSDAKSACDKAVELNSKDADDWMGIGHIYRRINLFDNSIAAYEKVLSIRSKEAWAYNGLGLVYEKLKKFEKAIEFYKQAIDLHINDINRAVTWDNMSDVYNAQKHYTDAITASCKSVELDPASAPHWYNLGSLYYFTGDLESAFLSFDKASGLNPTRGLYQSVLVSVLRKLGRNKDADERQKIAQPLMEKESDYNRACFEAICGDREEALNLLKIAIEQHEIDLVWAQQDPDFDSIRDDPRFKELVGLE